MAFDLQIGAATAFMEASGEPLEGQRGVCHVLINRLKDGRWGGTLAAVCLAPSQFSCWNTSDPNRKRLALTPDANSTLINLQALLQGILAGDDEDPTLGALWYFAPTICRPSWASDYVQTVKLGNHLFFKDPQT